MIEQLKADLIRDEGVVKYAYFDSENYITVGVGFMIDQRKGGGLRDEEIDFILDNRIRLVVEELSTRWPPFQACPEPVQRALANAAYNLGVNGLLKFTKMLAALDKKDYNTAADEALNSRWAQQVPNRSRRISEMIRGCAK